MAELRERDFRAALDFVGEVHDAQDREEFRAIVLPGYRSLVPAMHVSYNEIEGDGTVLAAIVEPELPEWSIPAWERYAGENPLLQRYRRTRDGREPGTEAKPLPPPGRRPAPSSRATRIRVHAYNHCAALEGESRSRLGLAPYPQSRRSGR